MVAVWIFGIGAGALMLTLMLHLRAVKPKIREAQITFSESSFGEVVKQWGPGQLAKVKSHFALDYAFLIAYGGFGLSLAVELQHGFALPSQLLAVVWPWLLPLAAACDALENVLHQRFLREPPVASPQGLFVLSGCAASTKWVLFYAYVILLAVWFVASAQLNH